MSTPPPAPPPFPPPKNSRYAAANSVSYVAPTLGAWLGYTSTTSAAAAAAAATAAAATAASTSAAAGAGTVGAFSAVSGAAGAGVAGYKMTRRTAGVRVSWFYLVAFVVGLLIVVAVSG